MRSSTVALCLAASAVLAACGGAASGVRSSEPPGGVGAMTAAAGSEAVEALCQMRTASDHHAANAAFFDRAHQTLHVLAAAVEGLDRGAAARLLEAKQVVEAELGTGTLPRRFTADVDALLDATRPALEAIGLAAPAC